MHHYSVLKRVLMSQPSSPTPPSMRTPLVVGMGIAIAGIVLFLIIYGLMSSAGVQAVPRLFVSLCVPPALIAVSVGAYILIVRPRH